MVSKDDTAKPADLKTNMNQLEKVLDLYLRQKAPALPKNIKEIIVKFSPYIILIMLIISLPAILAVLGIGTLLTPFSYLGGIHYGFTYILGLVVLAVSLVLEVIALPGLFKQKKQAWNLIYYSTLINAVHSLLIFNLGSLIIGTLISLYILFQIKEYYK